MCVGVRVCVCTRIFVSKLYIKGNTIFRHDSEDITTYLNVVVGFLGCNMSAYVAWRTLTFRCRSSMPWLCSILLLQIERMRKVYRYVYRYTYLIIFDLHKYLSIMKVVRRLYFRRVCRFVCVAVYESVKYALKSSKLRLLMFNMKDCGNVSWP